MRLTMVTESWLLCLSKRVGDGTFLIAAVGAADQQESASKLEQWPKKAEPANFFALILAMISIA